MRELSDGDEPVGACLHFLRAGVFECGFRGEEVEDAADAGAVAALGDVGRFLRRGEQVTGRAEPPRRGLQGEVARPDLQVDVLLDGADVLCSDL